MASHWGGTRNGTSCTGPGIAARGEIRPPVPPCDRRRPDAVLEAAGLPELLSVHGVQQRPLEGVSMASTFAGADAAEWHETQYFEMFCNRRIYHRGWSGVTRHSMPWAFGVELPSFDDEVWELRAPDDWTQAHNLAAERQRCWVSCSGACGGGGGDSAGEVISLSVLGYYNNEIFQGHAVWHVLAAAPCGDWPRPSARGAGHHPPRRRLGRSPTPRRVNPNSSVK
jgi:hypothetical protein